VTNPYRALCAELVIIEDAMSGGSVQLSSQGQALDGYAGLTAFRYIADKARIALSQPEPVAPTDEELDELKDDYWWLDANHSKPWIPFARAVLARWGTPAIQPVPVSERLPGPEDCDAEGRCWWFVPEDDEQPSNWYLDGQPPAREIRFYGNTHWLPHYALPTPRSGTH